MVLETSTRLSDKTETSTRPDCFIASSLSSLRQSAGADALDCDGNEQSHDVSLSLRSRKGQVGFMFVELTSLRNINYVVMLEVQKTLTGYRVKMQYDADVLTTQQAKSVLALYDWILSAMVSNPESTVDELFEMPSTLDKMWA